MASDLEVGDDDDTVPSVTGTGVCPRCAARSSVDAALVRAHVSQVTIVTRLEYPRVGGAPCERSRVALALPHGLAIGEGASREEALERALEQAGHPP